MGPDRATVLCGNRIKSIKGAQATFKASRYQTPCKAAFKEHAANPSWTAVASSTVAALALLIGPCPASLAGGLESVDLLSGLQSIKTPTEYRSTANKEAAKLQEAEEAFQKSDTLKQLLERSAANRDKNRKAIQDKYCYRQAELGIGDCGGLRYIPGMTESGKQRTPDWLSDLLGMERAAPADSTGPTLKSLFGGQVPE